MFVETGPALFRFINISWGKKLGYVWFEVLTAVVVKSSVSWDITPYSPLKVNRRALLATCFTLLFLLDLLFDPEGGSDTFLLRTESSAFLMMYGSTSLTDDEATSFPFYMEVVPEPRSESFPSASLPLHCSLIVQSFDPIRRGLMRLWLYKENNKLRDWKNEFTYSPLSSTHLWLRCSNFFNPSKKNYSDCAANRKSQRLISTLRMYLLLPSENTYIN
jgi:hypothetical protein